MTSDAADERPVYVISVAAELAGMHPQTLRTYDRLGLVSPGRTGGQSRRYSERDLERLRQVQRLSQQDGVSLPGIQRILDLEDQVSALRARVGELQHAVDRAECAAADATAAERRRLRRDLVPVQPASTSVVVWRRR